MWFHSSVGLLWWGSSTSTALAPTPKEIMLCPYAEQTDKFKNLQKGEVRDGPVTRPSSCSTLPAASAHTTCVSWDVLYRGPFQIISLWPQGLSPGMSLRCRAAQAPARRATSDWERSKRAGCVHRVSLAFARWWQFSNQAPSGLISWSSCREAQMSMVAQSRGYRKLERIWNLAVSDANPALQPIF